MNPCVAGRLEDKSALVRKQALLLLASLLSFNPFAPQLPEDRFVATLEEYQRKLQVSLPSQMHCQQSRAHFYQHPALQHLYWLERLETCRSCSQRLKLVKPAQQLMQWTPSLRILTWKALRPAQGRVLRRPSRACRLRSACAQLSLSPMHPSRSQVLCSADCLRFETLRHRCRSDSLPRVMLRKHQHRKLPAGRSPSCEQQWPAWTQLWGELNSSRPALLLVLLPRGPVACTWNFLSPILPGVQEPTAVNLCA